MNWESKFEKIPPNPVNIQQYLGTKIKAKILSVTIRGEEITIETDTALTTTEQAELTEFLKTGVNSLWKFKEQKEKKEKDART